MLAVPVFGDQPSNADRAVETGHAVRIQPSTDMAEDMRRALRELISNDRLVFRRKRVLTVLIVLTVFLSSSA